MTELEKLKKECAEAVKDLKYEHKDIADILVRCECKGHVIEAQSYEFGGVHQINLMMLTSDYGCNGWMDRIRLAWRMLKHGRAECTDIELSPENAMRLGMWLIEQGMVNDDAAGC
jgi:hypothetical protein